MTVDGYKAIENITIGDSVWAYSDTLGLTKKQKVIQVFRNETDKYFVIKFGGKKIEATPEHPFFVNNKWVKAEDLKVGDKLTTFDKKQVTVESIEFVHKNAPVFVYNFTIEHYHTYYVSNDNILVHNTGGCGDGGKLHGNHTDAEGNFILYDIHADGLKKGELVKVGKGKQNGPKDLMADGETNKRMHESERQAKKKYPNAKASVREELGRTTTGAATNKEAAEVVKERLNGNPLPLNKEKAAKYHPPK